MFKQTIKHILRFFHLDVTKNLKYDRLTAQIIKQFEKKDFICIDIKCDLGEILNLMIKKCVTCQTIYFLIFTQLLNHIKHNFKVNVFPYEFRNEN